MKRDQPRTTAQEIIATHGPRPAPEDFPEIYEQVNGADTPLKVADASVFLDAGGQAPLDAPVVGVIVETREHENLAFVVGQVLAQGIPVQVIHGPKNADFVRDVLAAGIASGKVTCTPLSFDALDRDRYNGLLLSAEFWNRVIGRGKVLVFQTDAVLCPGSPYDIGDFLDFDYIGSAWGRERRRGVVVDGGNGGLSLRDWTLSVECLERFPPGTWWSGGEDLYFCFHIELVGGHTATMEDSFRFGSQSWFADRSFGAHKIEQMRFWSRVAFLSWCPEGRILLGPGWLPEAMLADGLRAVGLAPLVLALHRRMARNPG